MQSCTSVSLFKRHLSHQDPVIPAFLYFGERKQQINHCRLRLEISNLNSDLYKRHLSDNPLCFCGHPNENAAHFLLQCPCFTNARQITIDTLPLEFRNLHTLIFGCDQLDTQTNTIIFSTEHEFLESSQRF